MKVSLKKSITNEKGQALVIVLILMLVGGLIIAPLLSYMSTGIKVGKEVYESKMYEFYAADAGVEDALWHLQTDERLAQLDPPYDLPDNINDKDVRVTIDRAWLLEGLHNSTPDANDHWTVIGAINYENLNNYIVDIVTDEPGTTLVDHMGVWLPPGYGYDDSVTINGVGIGGEGDPLGLVSNPTEISHRGGTALIWEWSTTPTFEELSSIAPPPVGHPPAEKFPPSVRLSFDYTVTPFKEAKGFFPWIKLVVDDRIAWDTEAGVYRVQSTSGSTTVEAYTPRGVMRYTSGSGGTSSAIKGDHIVIGNTLMTCCWGDECHCNCGSQESRNYMPGESSAQVLFAAVPDDATIERAYLYWTAWLRGDWLWVEEGQGDWLWGAYMGDDDYWEENAPEEVKDWLKANAYDGTAYLAVNNEPVTPTIAGDPAGTVFVGEYAEKYYGKTYISEGSSDVQPSYQYACFADVTDQVTEIITETEDVGGAVFTVAGVHAHPAESCGSGNKWNNSSNAGWSMIIIYSSEDKETHQIYLYEGCDHLWNSSREFTIAGFETPLDLEPGETNETKLTVFASEGDEFWGRNEYLRFKGENTDYYDLYDLEGNRYVFNSISSTSGFTPSEVEGQPEGQISGVDIDTYTRTRPYPRGTPLSDIVQPGDTSANIKVRSHDDGFMLIYVVFSVRSTKVPAGGGEFQVGTMTYEIK